jgi:hypothetical protein
VAAVILILFAVGYVTLTVARQHGSAGSSGRGIAGVSKSAGQGGEQIAAAATVRKLAAEWITRQVSPGTKVACDPLMCSALQSLGIPATNLLVLGPAAADPLGADLVVATPAVRSQFGSRLDSVYAPSVMAGFGSGAGRVNVRVIAPDGAPAYLAALSQDVAARKAAGAQLLANRQIKVTAQARAQLATGRVDSRLLIMLPVLARVHPVRILAFGDPGPGASSGIPLCSADLSGSARAAGMSDASYQRWLMAFLRFQRPPFAASIAVLRQGGQPIVRVQFSMPSPLGLLGHG